MAMNHHLYPSQYLRTHGFRIVITLMLGINFLIVTPTAIAAPDKKEESQVDKGSDKNPEDKANGGEASPKLLKAAKSLKRKISSEKNSVKKSIQLRSLGVLQFMMGYHADAEESFKRALAIDPDLKFNFRKVKSKGVKNLWLRVKRSINRDQDVDMFAGSVEEQKNRSKSRRNVASAVPYPGPSDNLAAARQRTMAKYGKKSSTGDYLMATLPLGTGQFNNGDYILGLSFLMSQGFAAVHWNQLMNRKSDYEERRSKVWADLAAGGADEMAINSYSKEADIYIDTMQKRANVALGSFFALWIASSAEASTQSIRETRSGRDCSLVYTHRVQLWDIQRNFRGKVLVVGVLLASAVLSSEALPHAWCLLARCYLLTRCHLRAATCSGPL